MEISTKASYKMGKDKDKEFIIMPMDHHSMENGEIIKKGNTTNLITKEGQGAYSFHTGQKLQG